MPSVFKLSAAAGGIWLFGAAVTFLNQNYDTIFHSDRANAQLAVFKAVAENKGTVRHAVQVASQRCIEDMLGEKPTTLTVSLIVEPLFDLMDLPSVTAGQKPSEDEIEQSRKKMIPKLKSRAENALSNASPETRSRIERQIQKLNGSVGADAVLECVFPKALETIKERTET